MTEMIANHKVSIVTAVLPRENSGKVINRVFNEGDPSVLLMQARGTLAKDRWYQSILPLVSPEKSILQFYVPDPEVDHIMEVAIANYKLASNKKEGREMMEQALVSVGLRPEETLGRFPHQLSGVAEPRQRLGGSAGRL